MAERQKLQKQGRDDDNVSVYKPLTYYTRIMEKFLPCFCNFAILLSLHLVTIFMFFFITYIDYLQHVVIESEA